MIQSPLRPVSMTERRRDPTSGSVVGPGPGVLPCRGGSGFDGRRFDRARGGRCDRPGPPQRAGLRSLRDERDDSAGSDPERDRRGDRAGRLRGPLDVRRPAGPVPGLLPSRLGVCVSILPRRWASSGPQDRARRWRYAAAHVSDACRELPGPRRRRASPGGSGVRIPARSTTDGAAPAAVARRRGPSERGSWRRPAPYALLRSSSGVPPARASYRQSSILTAAATLRQTCCRWISKALRTSSSAPPCSW